jgi:hypothetical protein
MSCIPHRRLTQNRLGTMGFTARLQSCVGKRNWLFIGHPDAGWRSAVIYSLVITARRYRLDPAAWLSDVLRRIPTCTQANLPELLPWNWKPQAA